MMARTDIEDATDPFFRYIVRTDRYAVLHLIHSSFYLAPPFEMRLFPKICRSVVSFKATIKNEK